MSMSAHCDTKEEAAAWFHDKWEVLRVTASGAGMCLAHSLFCSLQFKQNSNNCANRNPYNRMHFFRGLPLE